MMVRVILSTRPEMRWDGQDWSLFIPQHLSKRFGRCLKHLTEEDKAYITRKRAGCIDKGSEKMSNGKSASKSNPNGIRNTKKPIARRQRRVGEYPDKSLTTYLENAEKEGFKYYEGGMYDVVVFFGRFS